MTPEQEARKGGKVDKGFLVDHRSKASRKARHEVLADDLDYTPEDLDRSVVVPDQIRTILRTYRDAVPTELFPGRTLLPKTLIFAKDDSHAEDIVHICRLNFTVYELEAKIRTAARSSIPNATKMCRTESEVHN